MYQGERERGRSLWPLLIRRVEVWALCLLLALPPSAMQMRDLLKASVDEEKNQAYNNIHRKNNLIAAGVHARGERESPQATRASFVREQTCKPEFPLLNSYPPSLQALSTSFSC